MVESQSMLLSSLITAWGVVTALLAVLVIYRGTLSMKEDDQIFLDAAVQHHFQDQQVTIAKMSRLRTPIIGLAIVSGVLLLGSIGVWISEGLKSF